MAGMVAWLTCTIKMVIYELENALLPKDHVRKLMNIYAGLLLLQWRWSTMTRN